MKLSDYSYDLPEPLIAARPPKIRGETRLLALNRLSGQYKDDLYKNLDSYLKPGDLLVLNDTKVFKARLFVKNQKNQEQEIVILEKHGKKDDWLRHKIIYRGSLNEKDELLIDDIKIIVDKILGDGLAIIRSTTDLLEMADKYGNVPLPPYIKRIADKDDVLRYQTLWANKNGSVAAPTASLNMTEDLLKKLKSKGVNIAYLTLHVGLGTFLPIRTDNIEDHTMHKEYFEVPESTVEAIAKTKNNNGRVVALGTTVTRTLEYCADKLNENIKHGLQGEADIFIYPGYNFKMVDVLITNFHAPKSTVLMMAAAFADWDKLYNAYNHAISRKYKFLSYGDSMVIY